MKNLFLTILILLPLSCWDSLSSMHGDLTMKVPVCVHFTKGNDANDGRGWRNAFKTIGAAVNSAQAGDEIWVANPESEPVTVTISITKTVSIYGGFDGTESRRDERNLSRKTKIISSSPQIEINSSSIIMDGFYITGSREKPAINILPYTSALIKNCEFNSNTNTNPGNNGGAIYCDSGVVKITDCSFKSNSATNAYGGAIYCVNSNMEIEDTEFKTNSTRYGGAISSDGSSIKISGCIFNANISSYSGGAIYSNGDVNLQITDSTFITNESSAQYGGGIYSNDSKLIVKNSIFEGNTSVSPGGAIYIYGENTTESPIIIVNSLFSNNQCTAATFYGGGIYCINNSDTPEIYVINSTFYNNTGTSTTNSGSFYINPSVTAYIYNSIFYENSGSYSIEGGTVYCYNNAWDKGKSSGGDTVNTQVLTSSPFMSTDYGSGMFLRITSDSPCVNTGLNDIPGFTMPETDLGGFPRIVDGTVDIGAYEYQ